MLLCQKSLVRYCAAFMVTTQTPSLIKFACMMGNGVKENRTLYDQ